MSANVKLLGAFGFAFRLIRHTHSQRRLGLLARSSICWKPKHATVREHVMGESKPANKCDRSGGEKKRKGAVFSASVHLRAHVQTEILGE